MIRQITVCSSVQPIQYRYPTQPREAEDFFEGMVKVGASLIVAGLVGIFALSLLK